MRALLGLILFIGTASVNAAPQNARDVVEGAATQAIQALKKNRPELERSPAKIYDFVREYLLPYFDFEYASRLVLAKYWRTATPEERERFQAAFQRTLIRSYASSMLKYSDQKIQFLPYRETAGSDETTVKTEVNTDSGKPVAVDYNLRRNAQGEWKVYDVIIDGISVVLNYRSTFASEIRRLNGLAPLIERMEERNRSNVLEPEPAAPSSGNDG
ncbi:MAG: ABC transporter substrate-binding protein [Chromatiales bacterium]|nr:ABC transporter substrate-binding protein [Chromatiales bacterium]